MSALVLKLTLILVLVTAGVIGVIHLQPYDDTPLRALLVPPDACPLDCLLRIQPGKTTAAQALAVLRDHPWVAQVKDNPYQIAWMWSGAQSDLIDSDLFGRIRVNPETRIVQDITVQTRIPIGSLWLLLGTPEAGGVSGYERYLFHTAFYVDEGMVVLHMVDCPVQQRSYWAMPIQVTFYKPIIKLPVERYTPPTWNTCGWALP
mgnify:CR=1 FL=1